MYVIILAVYNFKDTKEILLKNADKSREENAKQESMTLFFGMADEAKRKQIIKVN